MPTGLNWLALRLASRGKDAEYSRSSKGWRRILLTNKITGFFIEPKKVALYEAFVCDKGNWNRKKDQNGF